MSNIILCHHVCIQSKFEKDVLPIYFKQNSIASFCRQANGWGFRRECISFILFQYMSTMYVTHYCCPLRITTIGIFKGSGADQGSYYNELFLRGKPHLVKVIRRIGGARKAAKNATIHFEPELYKISEIHPLPSTEMARVSSPKDYIVLDIINRMIIQGGPTTKLPYIV